MIIVHLLAPVNQYSDEGGLAAVAVEDNNGKPVLVYGIISQVVSDNEPGNACFRIKIAGRVFVVKARLALKTGEMEAV